MSVIKSQNLVRLENSISETNLVAIIRQEPAEIISSNKLEFRQSFDDLDYLVFAILCLPSGDRIALIRHDNSPSSGTEICVRHNQENIPAVLFKALTKMNLTLNDLTWIYPEYEQQLRINFASESEIEVNTLCDPNNKLDNSSEGTIFLLNEPELIEILQFTLEQVTNDDLHHVLCCFVIDDLTIDLDSKSTSDLQENSQICEILLYRIAAKIKFHLSSDYIARLSDNELVTLVPNCSLEEASTIINRLREDLNDLSFQWQGNEYPINTSVGLVEINADSINTADLISVVKATCKIAKKKVEVKTLIY